MNLVFTNHDPNPDMSAPWPFGSRDNPLSEEWSIIAKFHSHARVLRLRLAVNMSIPSSLPQIYLYRSR